MIPNHDRNSAKRCALNFHSEFAARSLIPADEFAHIPARYAEALSQSPLSDAGLFEKCFEVRHGREVGTERTITQEKVRLVRIFIIEMLFAICQLHPMPRVSSLFRPRGTLPGHAAQDAGRGILFQPEEIR